MSPRDKSATGGSVRLLNGETGPITGSAFNIAALHRTYRAYVSGTGAVTATVEFYGNNVNDANGILLGAITLSGTNSAVDGFPSDAPWPYVWAKITAISGTGAAVIADVGV